MDIDRLPDPETRRKALTALAVWRAENAAYDAKIEAIKEKHAASIAEADAMRHRAGEAYGAQRLELEVAENEWLDQPRGAEMPEGVQTEDDGDMPLVCARTGLPILDDDAMVTDEITGEVFLKAALMELDAEGFALPPPAAEAAA